MSDKVQQIGDLIVRSRRIGAYGEYHGLAGIPGQQAIYVSKLYGGRGASVRAFEDAKQWAIQHQKGKP